MKRKISIKVILALTTLLSLTEVLNLIIEGKPNDLPVTIAVISFLWFIYFIDICLQKLAVRYYSEGK